MAFGDTRPNYRHGRLLLLPLLLLTLVPWADSQADPFGETWQTGESVVASTGCTSAVVPEPPATLTLGGLERPFITRLPRDYTPGRPHDLVVAFHGRTNPNSQVQGYYDIDESLPRAIIVYPSAIPFESGFRWSDPGDAPAELRDFALFDSLVARFSADYCIDLKRIFVVGHSLGASFANNVACHRGELVRAVASVAGGIGNTVCEGGAAALVIHHPADRLVPIANGHRVRDAFVVANRLPPEPVPASRPELARLDCVRYGGATPNPVIWCQHDFATTRGGRYYPHNWPEATDEAIARFFSDLP